MTTCRPDIMAETQDTLTKHKQMVAAYLDANYDRVSC